MTRRLLGPIGGPIIFLLVAGLVFAGLGRVTVASLRVERAQQEAAAQADRLSRMQRAVWRMDGRLLPVFAVEDSRPFHHYASPNGVFDYPPPSAPLLAGGFRDWIRLHFQLSQGIGWDSPQVLPSETVAGLRQHWPGLPLQNVTKDRIDLLTTLRAKYPTSQAIEIFAARERAIPAGSDPLAIPLFVDNSAPPSAPAPHPSPPGPPEAAPPSTGLINIMPPPAPAAETQGAGTSFESLEGSTAALKDPVVTGSRAELQQTTPAQQFRFEPQAAPPSDYNSARMNNRLLEDNRGGEYALRAQSIARGMKDAKSSAAFTYGNPTHGDVGPLALRNYEKPPMAGPSPLATTAPGLPVPPNSAASAGFAGGFGGGSPPLVASPPSVGIGGAMAPPLPGVNGVVPETGSGLSLDAEKQDPADRRKEMERIDQFARGAAGSKPADGERDLSRFKKETSAAANGTKKEMAKDVAEFFYAVPNDGGLLGLLGDAIRAKKDADRAREVEEKQADDTKSLASRTGGKEAQPMPSSRPADTPRRPAAMGAMPGGPIASGLMNPNGERALPLAPTSGDKLFLAPTGPQLGRATMPEAKPAAPPAPRAPGDPQPDGLTRPDGLAAAEPIPPRPDPMPPPVLEPAPAEPVVPGEDFTPTVAVHLGSMRPQWLTAADGTEMLVLVRAARLENKTVYQGVVLDWPKLETVLKDEVKDLFPEAKLVAVKDPSGVPLERAMTALPVQLDPGPMPEPPPLGWTPLRFGLVVAWAAAIIAFVAVGLCGWSLIDLSERRIRFVSAVTHELRTPLTALRLYIDLLLSGMVQDEEKRREYLSTLNAESDRLHRLIDNVLDFARLERQRKGNSVETVKVTDLLDQIRITWTDRCGTDHKELVVVSTLPAEAEVSTDPVLVQQIIGNLIDNARKYTRDAEDNRIWVWAKTGGRDRVFIEVEDRGSGIPARERSVIFRPFRRGESADTRAGGAGLGLALSKQWAEVLGGRLTCRPADGGTGTCFRLELRAK